MPSSKEDDDVKIQIVDMEEGMQKHAIETSIEAIKNNDVEMEAAAHVKREFDQKYGPTWHCVIGNRFGSYVTHESKVINNDLWACARAT